MENPEYNMPMGALGTFMSLLVTCLGGIQVFEDTLTDLAALRYDLLYCEELGDHSAVALSVVGCFKGHELQLHCYMIPITGTTYPVI